VGLKGAVTGGEAAGCPWRYAPRCREDEDARRKDRRRERSEPRTVVRESEALSSSPEISDFWLAVRTLRVLTTSRDAEGVSNDSERIESSRLGRWRCSPSICR